MAGRAVEGARLSRSEVETARREVHRAVTSTATDTAARTLTPVRTTGRTWPGINAIEPEPIAQIEAAHAIEQTAHTLIKGLTRLVKLGEGGTQSEMRSTLTAMPPSPKSRPLRLLTTARSTTRPARACAPSPGPVPPCQKLITTQDPFSELPGRE